MNFINIDIRIYCVVLLRVVINRFQDKISIMQNKWKLMDQDCYINDDMTKQEREIQAAIRKRAREGKGQLNQGGLPKNHDKQSFGKLADNPTPANHIDHYSTKISDHRTKLKENGVKIATLNTRNLRTCEREADLEHALKNVNFDIIGLSEVRKVGEAAIEQGFTTPDGRRQQLFGTPTETREAEADQGLDGKTILIN